jgi:hypothetical protein
MTLITEEVAARFPRSGAAEKVVWNPEGVLPRMLAAAHSPYLEMAKITPCEKWGGNRVSKVSGASALSISHPVVTNSYRAVRRKFDIVVERHGRIKIDEVMGMAKRSTRL